MTAVAAGTVVVWDDPDHGPRTGVVTKAGRLAATVQFDNFGCRDFAVVNPPLHRVEFESREVLIDGVATGCAIEFVQYVPATWKVQSEGAIIDVPESNLRLHPDGVIRQRAKNFRRGFTLRVAAGVDQVRASRGLKESTHARHTSATAAVANLRRELARRTADRPSIEATINSERCGGDPAESEGSRVAMLRRLENESAIDELKAKIMVAASTPARRRSNRTVQLGSRVTVCFDDNRGDTDTYLIGDHSFEPGVDACSPHSPLGSAILTRRVGSRVVYSGPDRTTRIATVLRIV